MQSRRGRWWWAALGVGIGTLGCGGASESENPTEFRTLTTGPGALKILRGDDVYLDASLLAWGPNWSWAGVEAAPPPPDDSMRSAAPSAGGLRKATIKFNTGATVAVEAEVQPAGATVLEAKFRLESDQDTALTGIVLALRPTFAGSVAADDQAPVKLPVAIHDFGANVETLRLTDEDGANTTVRIDPGARVSADGTIRIFLAGESLKAKTPLNRTIRIELPRRVALGTAGSSVDAGTDGWFPLPITPTATGTDELSLADWLDAPAGKHGRVKSDGAHLTVNGKRTRLWGINLCYSDCAPPKELAIKRAEFYARNGINAVRLHKYADGPGWAGIQAPGSYVEFDREAVDRMDFFVAELKKRGIYVKLSPTFIVALGPDDVRTVPYLREFGEVPKPGERLRTMHGSIYLSREIQDLQIEQTRRILQHRNPYTGLTYAQDPAVAIVEMYNEDSALFFGTMERLQKVPTLRQRASAAFSAWLRRKYGTEAKLKEAWGNEALNSFTAEGFTGESLTGGTIVPAGNPWFFDPDQLSGSQKFRAVRLRDTMRFLYETQNEFYDRFLAAIRQAGYAGEVLTSNWIAGRAYSHFYNLHSDARVGMIDRHNYFGGRDGDLIADGSMLQKPGMGMLSTGMNQVSNRPFSLSEWIHVFPNEWGAEGPAILGAYGMGLQGWDVSFIFQNRDNGEWSDRIGRDQWDATAPQVMGLFPAVSRQVLRGDVRESELVIPRYVTVDDLLRGDLGFDDQGDATGDIKTSGSRTVPIESLAVGRSVVEFTQTARATPTFNVDQFLRDGALVSSTGQLAWTAGRNRKDGWFRIDTPGTQAVVGFTPEQDVALSDVTIRPRSRFAAIYVTAPERDGKLAESRRWLVTALARARNTGMEIDGPVLLSQGKAPILLEPVRTTLTLKRPGAAVHILDANGRRTGRRVPVENGVAHLDTGRDGSPWYLVTYGEGPAETR